MDVPVKRCDDRRGPLVSRGDSRPVARLLGDDERMDPGCVRLQHPRDHPARHPAELHRRQCAGGRARDRHAGHAAPRRRRRRHGGGQVGPQGTADAVDPLVLAVRVSQRLLEARTRCCSACARCSASAWAACGPRGCRSSSSIGRRGCAASSRGCCSADGTGAISSRRPRFSSSIRSLPEHRTPRGA